MLFLNAYSAAAGYVRKGSDSWQIHYIGHDYLGSITHITDAESNLKEEYSYDPWGRLRNPQDHILYEIDQDPKLLLTRGYTGHEHLPMFGLINMNARLYDPVVGRFLSPNPYVQAPDFSQSYNRYSYCWNNPPRYTDENGEFILTGITTFFAPPLIPLAILANAAWMGAAWNVYSNWDDITKNGEFSWSKFGSYAGFGAISGIGIASGNPWVALGSQALVGAGNNMVRNNDYSFDGIIQSASISMGTYALTAGLTKIGPKLDEKFSNVFKKLGLSSLTSEYAGEFTSNYAVNFALGIGEGYIHNDIDFSLINKRALSAATITTGISATQNMLSSLNKTNTTNSSIEKQSATDNHSSLVPEKINIEVKELQVNKNTYIQNNRLEIRNPYGNIIRDGSYHKPYNSQDIKWIKKFNANNREIPR